jgi:feruloyl esterase
MFGRMNVASGDFAERIVPFLARGGKLILYHGYSDGLITPYGTVQYYRDLAHVLGGYERAQRSMQLYMVPGMYHCSGGPGPNNFGQPQVLPRDTDPLHDATRALEQWVEDGIAPRMFIATKFTNDDLTQAPIRTMPLCPFPAQARYLGSGDVNDAANWQCPSNDRSQLEIGLDGRQAGLRAPLFTGERSRGHHGFDQDTGSAGRHRPDAANEGDRANGRR